MQWPGLILALLPPVKSSRRTIFGSKIRCRSAASTSQSTRTHRFARVANDATTEVLPVPPLPLMTTSSFIVLLHWESDEQRTNLSGKRRHGIAGQLAARIGFGHGPVVGDLGQDGDALARAVLTDLIVADVTAVEHDGQRKF